MRFAGNKIVLALVIGWILMATWAQAAVQLGVDVLESAGYAPLKGKRVGLVSNQTSVDSSGVRTRVLLKKSVNPVALYTPEHGLDGTEKAGRYVSSRRDPLTGSIAHSLYGPTRKPTPATLRGIDTLVFDLQDIGCRSYTYEPHAAANLTAINIYALAELNRELRTNLITRSSRGKRDMFFKCYGSASIQSEFARGNGPAAIVTGWADDVVRFKGERSQYLLY